ATPEHESSTRRPVFSFHDHSNESAMLTHGGWGVKTLVGGWLPRLQSFEGRAFQNRTGDIEAAAVAGTIPALFAGIPMDDALHVRTNRRQQRKLAIRCTVGGITF